MHFKAIIAILEPDRVSAVLDAAGHLGVKGATLLSGARGQGRVPLRTFFGLSLDSQRDVILFLAPDELCDRLLQVIHDAGDLDSVGAGVAFQFDVQSVVGLTEPTTKKP